jgi:hypothetical protein
MHPTRSGGEAVSAAEILLETGLGEICQSGVLWHNKRLLADFCHERSAGQRHAGRLIEPKETGPIKLDPAYLLIGFYDRTPFKLTNSLIIAGQAD